MLPVRWRLSASENVIAWRPTFPAWANGQSIEDVRKEVAKDRNSSIADFEQFLPELWHVEEDGSATQAVDVDGAELLLSTNTTCEEPRLRETWGGKRSKPKEFVIHASARAAGVRSPH